MDVVTETFLIVGARPPASAIASMAVVKPDYNTRLVLESRS